MSLLDYFRNRNNSESASVAKQRLQVLVAHERTARNQPDYLPEMQQEILAVIRKYVSIDQEDVSVQLDRSDSCSVLELNVTLPQ